MWSRGLQSDVSDSALSEVGGTALARSAKALLLDAQHNACEKTRLPPSLRRQSREEPAPRLGLATVAWGKHVEWKG